MLSLIDNSIVGFLVAILVTFAYIAFYYRSKYFKTRDELLNLADEKGFFTKKPSIMWDSEKQFFNILIKLYGNNYFIFPQVRLADLLNIKNNVIEHDNLYREIDHYSIDFVIFDRVNITPLLAIELNGTSHFLMNRRNRDKKISNIITKVGIEFIAIPVNEVYNEIEIQKEIDSHLTIKN